MKAIGYPGHGRALVQGQGGGHVHDLVDVGAGRLGQAPTRVGGQRLQVTAGALSVEHPGVGKNNYGHPSDEVIEKLKEKGIITYRTDVDGAIGIRKEKGRITVCRQRTEKNRDIGTLPWILKRIHSETRY